MTDIKLNDQGDIDVIQLTANPTVIPEQQIPPCITFKVENNTEDILVQEDGESVFCFENATVNDGTIIPEQIVGDPAVYDINSQINTTNIRLKRALQTPLGYITMYTLDNGNMRLVDRLYGNAIYGELSEGLTLNFIARVRSHTINAINRAGLSASVSDVRVGILDQHTVQIHVFYNDGTPNTIIPIQL